MLKRPICAFTFFALFALSCLFPATGNAQFANPEFRDWVLIDTAQPYLGLVMWETSNHNDFFGFNNVSVERLIEGEQYYAKIESKQRAYDASIEGWIAQTIATRDLDRIDYRSRCDSLAGLGYCLVEIRAGIEDEVLFSDTIRTTDQEFQQRSITILPEWRERYPEFRVEFEAFGYVFALVPEMMAYSVFLLDKVEASYISNLASVSRVAEQLKVYPNPATDVVRLDLPVDFTAPTVEIYSVLGNLVASYANSGSTLSLAQLPRGMYLISVRDAGRVMMGKVVLEGGG
ncbi:T9SS type A sorting domain-containing protein [Neolewinella lacunae]|uniref:T9SS type A sorting domain-containing protein n=1 Tax=Neolewinella lacunae TaxID=1517758 RepID=A0A923PNJ9_9BACT|nr:T9SS type A sorting domain-containing protein [Neolewinella lacunae]MBC6993787.1 T9SS type A sorting domain-containing protein [Neolewinella lacunae]MDN3635322.1 T9SS type A sorting domain-containing protein [Neolewinella lacunae]